MKFHSLLTLLLVYLSSTATHAYSADELISLALKNNPLLKAAHHQMKASGSDYRKESILPKNPQVYFSYSNIPLTSFPSLTDHAMSGISIGLSQYIASPFESGARKKLLKNKHLAGKEIYREAMNGLALKIRQSHARLMYLAARKNILGKNKSTLQSISKVAESLVVVNKMNITQLLKIRAEVSDLSVSLKEVNGLIIKEMQNLEKLCGIPLKKEPDEKSVSSWISEKSANTLPEKFRPEEHPVYKKFEKIYLASRAAYRMEIARMLPGVTIGLDYRIRQKIEGKDNGDDFISLKASIPLPLYYPLKERHKIKAGKERLKAAKLDLQNAKLELSTAWKGERNNYRLLLKSFSEYHRQILPMYFSVYRNQLSILPAGRTTLIDVLDSYRLYLKASLKEARLYRDLTISRARLMYLMYNLPKNLKKEKGDSEK